MVDIRIGVYMRGVHGVSNHSNMHAVKNIENQQYFLSWQCGWDTNLHERLDPPPSSQYYIYSRECASAKFFETQLHLAMWAIYNGLPCHYRVKPDRPIVYLSAVVFDVVFPKTSRLVG